MSADKSGPAFPVQVRREEKYMDEGGYGRVRSFLITEGGMSLRDYFAAKAMPHLLHHTRSAEVTASEAYKMADAMLAARAKP